MRRLALIGGTLFAMIAAAGIGAFAAAHSEARDAPGVGGADGGSPAPVRSGGKPSAQRWHGVMVSRTSRGFRSGGTCTTDWRTSLRFAVDASGSISGSGSAKLASGPNCPFVTGQPQLRRFDVKVGGTGSGGRLLLRLDADASGRGIDYGGFDATFGQGRTLSVDVHGASASGHDVLRAVPADPTDVSIARNSIRLRTS